MNVRITVLVEMFGLMPGDTELSNLEFVRIARAKMELNFNHSGVREAPCYT